jgi:ADP-heptose:LPS heptosyltransferase
MVVKETDRAIVTVAIGDAYSSILRVSGDTMKRYADKVGADFIPITDMGIMGGNGFSPHWSKFNIYDLFKKYSRILFLDSDIIIRDDCIDLFDKVPDTKIGLFNEGAFSFRLPLLTAGSKAYNISIARNNSNPGTYYNTGVMVLSRKFRNLFHPPREHVEFEADYGEQTFINLRVRSMGISVKDIGYRYNRMTLMDKVTGEDRLSSSIIHYAGCPDIPTLHMVMSKDLNSWCKDSPNYAYQRRILINCTGGLGDQISAEPAIRHMKRVLYPNDIIYVKTVFPEIVDHLSEEVIIVNDATTVEDKAISEFKTSPVEDDPTDEISKFLSHPLIHPVDFASLALFRYSLPDNDKKVQLSVPDWAVDEVVGITGTSDLSDTVLVHPGKGWKSKTFPREWWEKIIQGIIAGGKRVGLLGKYLGEKQGYEDVMCPDGCYDFRDMLTLKGMFAAIRMAPVLLTNDSAPLHAAGAFNNWIIFIPTCKHPDYLIPFRDPNNRGYKAKALYKKLTCSVIDTSPTCHGESKVPSTIDVVEGDILDYLPDPEEVITAILECD